MMTAVQDLRSNLSIDLGTELNSVKVMGDSLRWNQSRMPLTGTLGSCFLSNHFQKFHGFTASLDN